MTQRYLAGELSVLLARLQALSDPAHADAMASMRQEAESVPVYMLCSVVTRALDAADLLCWESVSRGDAERFCGQSAAAAELLMFSECAGLFG